MTIGPETVLFVLVLVYAALEFRRSSPPKYASRNDKEGDMPSAIVDSILDEE